MPNQKVKDLFVLLAENSGVPCEITTDYSGRFMYGGKTVGVVLDQADVCTFLMDFGYNFAEMENDDEVGDVCLNEFHFSQDNMALQMILYLT